MFFKISKFYVDLFQKVCLCMFLPFIDAVNNQQSCGEVGMFQNKLPVIKYYYNFLDLQMCYADRTLGFESLLMVLELLALLHLESVLIVLLSHIYFKCLFFYRIFIVVLLN